MGFSAEHLLEEPWGDVPVGGAITKWLGWRLGFFLLVNNVRRRRPGRPEDASSVSRVAASTTKAKAATAKQNKARKLFRKEEAEEKEDTEI